MFKYLFFFFLFLAPFFTLAADPTYDLLVESATTSPNIITVNQKTRIAIKIKNNGTGSLFTTQGLSSYQFSASNFKLESMTSTVPSYSNIIKPSDYLIYFFEGVFIKPGITTVYFKINKDYSLAETDDSNNSISKEINIIPEQLPDLAVESLEFNKEDIILGDSLEITIKLKNISDSSLISAEGLRNEDLLLNFNAPLFVISSSTLDTLPSLENPLDPGEIFKYSFAGHFERYGDYDISFIANRNQVLKEKDFTNNSLTKRILVFINKNESDFFSFSDLNAFLIGSSSAQINWTTNRLTGGKVIYGKDEFGTQEYESISASSSALKHNVVIRSLKPNTRYAYKILGNRGDTKIFSNSQVFTSAIDDNLKITNFAVEVDQASSSAIFKWSTDLMANGKVFYKQSSSTDDYSFINAPDFSLAQNLKLVNLNPGIYQYYISAVSNLNKIAVSEIKYFEIEKPIQPIIEEIMIFNTTINAATSSSARPLVVDLNQNSLTKRLIGQIVLKVNDSGEAWYLNPNDYKRYYLGRPYDAFRIMRELSIGISDKNLDKIQLGDQYTPIEERINLDWQFANKHKGKIFLRTQKNGEAWYLNPLDLKRYYLGKPEDAFKVMRELSVGISNEDFDNL